MPAPSPRPPVRPRAGSPERAAEASRSDLPSAAGEPAGLGEPGTGPWARAAAAAAPAIVLVSTIAGRQLVARRCEVAGAAGVREGMTLAHARALLAGGELTVHPHEPRRDDDALQVLAAWAVQFAPLVAPDPPDGLLMDISGCARLYRGEARLVNAVANRLEWLGFGVRIAGAGTFGCAWAVARHGERDRSIVPDGAERDALARLPIDGLRLDEAIVDGLAEVGVESIDHLLELPRLEIAARFPTDLLLRLDQATGEAMETIDPVRPTSPPRVERVFDGPVKQLEAIIITVRELVEALSAQLERLESGVRRLDVTFDRIDAPPVHVLIMLSRPSRDTHHLWSLLKPKVESVHLGYGIERIEVRATTTGQLRHRQVTGIGGRSGAAADDEDGELDRSLGELLDVLSDRLGPDRTVRVRAVESHVPERSFARWPAMDAMRGRERSGDEAMVTSSDRPSRLLVPPEPAEVLAMMPDGPPSWLRWRGEAGRVITSIGPERIGGEWWGGSDGATKRQGAEETERRRDGEIGGRADVNVRLKGLPSASPSLRLSVSSSLPHRDYFKIQDERGRWLWVYRASESGRWFVHGEWG